MREAFSYMFKDNKYKNKALTYFVFVLISNFCIFFANTFVPSCSGGCPTTSTLPKIAYLYLLIGMFVSFVPLGYYFSCIKALIEQKENFVLPNFNFLKNLVQGLKYSISVIFATIIWGLGIIITSSIILVLANFVGGKVFLCALGIILVIAIILFFVILSVSFMWIFANTGWLSSFLRVQRALHLVRTNKTTYWLALGLITVVGIVAYIVSFIAPFIGSLTGSTIGMALIASALIATLSAYTAFVSAYLTAKSIKPVNENEV